MKIIDASAIRKVYRPFLKPEIKALDDITFSIEAGESVVFLGPNGAGKTTTIKVIVGLLRPDSGVVKIFKDNPNSIRIKQKIGFLPENSSFYRFLTGRENLLFLAKLENKAITEKRIDEVLDLVGLASVKDRMIKRYSRGMVQRLGIGQAIVHDPELLVLDEPLSNLDPVGRKAMRELLLAMKEDGKTIFFSTHILPDVEPLADRAIIINRGRIEAVTKIEKLGNLEDFLLGILQ